MNQVTLTIVAAPDGGIVVYSAGEEETSLSFAGNQKDACDYISKRVGDLLKSTPDKAGVTPYLREAKSLYDQTMGGASINDLRPIHEVTRYAVEA